MRFVQLIFLLNLIPLSDYWLFRILKPLENVIFGFINLRTNDPCDFCEKKEYFHYISNETAVALLSLYLDRIYKAHILCMHFSGPIAKSHQGRSQPHSPGCKSSTFLIFPPIFITFFFYYYFLKLLLLFFLKHVKLSSILSSFWPSRWASRPPGRALATTLNHIREYYFQ